MSTCNLQKEQKIGSVRDFFFFFFQWADLDKTCLDKMFRCRQLEKKLHVVDACPRGWDTHLWESHCLDGDHFHCFWQLLLSTAWVLTTTFRCQKNRDNFYFIAQLNLSVYPTKNQRVLSAMVAHLLWFSLRVLPPNCNASWKKNNKKTQQHFTQYLENVITGGG